MLIYVCCAGGATSSMLCQKISEASKKKVLIGYILELVKDMRKSLSEYDMVLAYGPADVIKDTDFKDTGLEDELSCVYIAPQVRFMAPAIKEYCDRIHVPVGVIDMHTFGFMDGEKAWNDIQEMMK